MRNIRILRLVNIIGRRSLPSMCGRSHGEAGAPPHLALRRWGACWPERGAAALAHGAEVWKTPRRLARARARSARAAETGRQVRRRAGRARTSEHRAPTPNCFAGSLGVAGGLPAGSRRRPGGRWASVGWGRRAGGQRAACGRRRAALHLAGSGGVGRRSAQSAPPTVASRDVRYFSPALAAERPRRPRRLRRRATDPREKDKMQPKYDWGCARGGRGSGPLPGAAC